MLRQALGGLDAAHLQQLEALAPPEGSLHHVVLAVYSLLLLRYSRQDDLCIATASPSGQASPQGLLWLSTAVPAQIACCDPGLITRL